MVNIGVLASTKATDMQAIIDAINAGKLDARISVVISNKKDAYALERAKKHNIRAIFLDPTGKEKGEYDKEIGRVLQNEKVELVLLIGYMKIISPWLVKKWKNRIMNIHPSLLPAFAGGMDKDVHKEVLNAKVKVTGATLHFVTENVDSGPIILQKEVRIEENETVGTLKEKVQKAEQEIILKAIRLYSEGKIRVEGSKVVVK
ncbi:phosphoribosylglycinamide formyltransferase [Candidatus Woesearchaeota archaeon]|nr:phosphoribosylglycinamide formyltransferase [Candidatus Woesearchaeota archaeon]